MSAKETYTSTKECCKYAKEPWISLVEIGAYSKEKGAEANLV